MNALLCLLLLCLIGSTLAGSEQLWCSNWDGTCHWHSAKSAMVPWQRSDYFIEPSQLMFATGTQQDPIGFYAIAASDVVDNSSDSSMRAALVSDVIPCQSGDGILTFDFWTSPFILFTVCSKSILSSSVDECNVLPASIGPGPTSVIVPDMNGTAF